MKRLIGALAIAGLVGAVAVKLLKDNEDLEDTKTIHTINNDTETEIESTQVEEEFDEEYEDDGAAMVNASYPNLTQEDIIRLNEISENAFEIIDAQEDERTERPLQHILTFEDENEKEDYKAIIIREGYVVTDGDEKELIVLNITKANPDTILEKVFQLADIAKKYHGTYVQWILK